MQRDYARVEQERELERAHGFEKTHGMGTTVGGFVTRCAGGKSQNSCDNLRGEDEGTFECSRF